MAFSDIEKAKVKIKVEGFITENRPPSAIRSEIDITYLIDNQAIELFEIRPRAESDSKGFPFAKIVYVRHQDAWKVYATRGNLKWKLFDVKLSLEAALKLIGEDARDCFFG